MWGGGYKSTNNKVKITPWFWEINYIYKDLFTHKDINTYINTYFTELDVNPTPSLTLRKVAATNIVDEILNPLGSVFPHLLVLRIPVFYHVLEK